MVRRMFRPFKRKLILNKGDGQKSSIFPHSGNVIK
jgi:hypothetical protein